MVFLAFLLYAFFVMQIGCAAFWALEMFYKLWRGQITVQRPVRFLVLVVPSLLVFTAAVIVGIWDLNNPDSIFAQYRNSQDSFWQMPGFWAMLVGFLIGSLVWERFLEKRAGDFAGITSATQASK